MSKDAPKTGIIAEISKTTPLPVDSQGFYLLATIEDTLKKKA